VRVVKIEEGNAPKSKPMKEKFTVLLVDDNYEFLASISRVLKKNFDVLFASDTGSAQKRVTEGVNAIVLDVCLDDQNPGDRQGLQLLSWFRQQHPNIPVIMMTAVDDLAVAVEAMKLGASDFIVKMRFHIAELEKAIAKAIQNSQLIRKVASLERRLEVFEPSDLIGNSDAITGVRNLIDMVAQDGECSVLIHGDTGTGKELVADAIHKRGKRRKGPFVAVSIAALPKDMVPAELFGHQKGAFTNALEARIGYIEEADGGILFLDEIGEVPLDTQRVLLRVLESREMVRIGATRPITVDFQLVAASNRDLKHAVSTGTFREDLYHRLKTALIYIPPLAARTEDIPELANHFLGLLRRSGRTTVRAVSSSAMEYLIAYIWPGNVRELKNCIDSAALRAKFDGNDEILPAHLPIDVMSPASQTAIATDRDNAELLPRGIDVDKELARLELTYIQRAIQTTGGKIAEASHLLGYRDRFTLRRRVEQSLRRYPELEIEFGNLRTKYNH
jgi:DNA-binding NtrC family response regulator